MCANSFVFLYLFITILSHLLHLFYSTPSMHILFMPMSACNACGHNTMHDIVIFFRLCKKGGEKNTSYALIASFFTMH